MDYKNGWNYSYLFKKISELENGLPKLIKNQEWDKIERMLYIPQENWDGVIVKAYDEYVQKIISQRNEEIKKVPGILRKAVEEMQRRDNEMKKIA